MTNSQSNQLQISLSKAIGKKECLNAKKFAYYIKKTCEKQNLNLSDANILLGYGGGKDSTWSLAFTRLAQLICRQEFQDTFNLQIFSMVHLGTPCTTLKNMHNVFERLKIFDDNKIPYPKIYCYGQVADFNPDYKIPEQQKNWLREDILLAGQRSQGNGRATFCQTCNLHMVNAGIFKLGQGIHFIITGDSTAELKSYQVWIQNILKQNNLLPLEKNGECKDNAGRLQQIHNKFYSDLLPAANYYTSGRYCSLPVSIYQKFAFIPIFDFTKYSLKDHWLFFKNFLHFNFSDEVLNFTETDCRHPLLMCHLRGLTAECSGRGYQAGVEEYLELVKHFFHEKEFHEQLISANLNKFSSAEKIKLARRQAEEKFENIGITKTQTICLVYSPIAAEGKNLHQYLKEQAPEFLPKKNEIKKYLAGDNRVNDDIKKFLQTQTGLNINLLRHLYLSPLFNPIYSYANGHNKDKNDCKNIFNIIIKNDPHQKKVAYKNSEGKKIKEVIFGR